jgi:hypothetical protein
VRAQTGYAFRVELVEPARSCFGVGHEAYILQHFEVLRNSGTRNGEQARELIDRDRPTGELLKDGHTGCVGERIESGLKVSVH